jgi:hypothetical protein
MTSLATVSLVQLLRDNTPALQARRWLDAEIVADTQKLLIDLDPQRRTLNANPANEADLWKSLSQRKDQLDRQLLLLVNGQTGDIRSGNLQCKSARAASVPSRMKGPSGSWLVRVAWCLVICTTP